jgi:hypothetical protein
MKGDISWEIFNLCATRLIDCLQSTDDTNIVKLIDQIIYWIFSDTTRDSTDGDYGIEDVRSDQDSDNEDEDETRIPGWAKGLFYNEK